MDLKIVGKCFIEQGSDLIVDAPGNKIPVNLVMFCKNGDFIITEDGDIDKLAGEEMDAICQAADKDFNFLRLRLEN